MYFATGKNINEDDANSFLQHHFPKGFHSEFITEGVGEADLDVLRTKTFNEADGHEGCARTYAFECDAGSDICFFHCNHSLLVS